MFGLFDLCGEEEDFCCMINYFPSLTGEESGGKTGGKNVQRLSFWFNTIGQKCTGLPLFMRLHERERLTYPGSMEEIEGLQLSLISTTTTACEAASQAVSFSCHKLSIAKM